MLAQLPLNYFLCDSLRILHTFMLLPNREDHELIELDVGVVHKSKKVSTLLQMSHQSPTQNVTALDERLGILGDSLGQGESLTA